MPWSPPLRNIFRKKEELPPATQEFVTWLIDLKEDLDAWVRKEDANGTPLLYQIEIEESELANFCEGRVQALPFRAEFLGAELPRDDLSDVDATKMVTLHLTVPYGPKAIQHNSAYGIFADDTDKGSFSHREAKKHILDALEWSIFDRELQSRWNAFRARRKADRKRGPEPAP